MATPEEEAVGLKNEGNKAFANHDWITAIDFYTKAIEIDPKVPAYYSNRAQVIACSTPFLCARVTKLCRRTSSPRPMDMLLQTQQRLLNSIQTSLRYVAARSSLGSFRNWLASLTMTTGVLPTCHRLHCDPEIPRCA